MIGSEFLPAEQAMELKAMPPCQKISLSGLAGGPGFGIVDAQPEHMTGEL